MYNILSDNGSFDIINNNNNSNSNSNNNINDKYNGLNTIGYLCTDGHHVYNEK